MTLRMKSVALAIASAFVVAFAMNSAVAQNTGVPNALQGFSQNRDKPVNIEAASLEVRDKDKVATFTGNVIVTQGDTILRCKSLLVFYEQEDAKETKGTMKAAKPGPGGKQGIRRLEARGGVIVVQKDQTATGATGIFDMKKNTITLSGGVVIAQGQNVLRGEQLVVDTTTGYAKVEGKVSGLFSTNSKDDKKDDKANTSGAASKDGHKSGSRPKSLLPSLN